jgi:L-lysine exporter family protein LysE/ArgO
MTTLPILKGFLIGAGMIIPIGAQNSYVLAQGIKKNYHIIAATICILCDFILMSVGVYGGGALITSNVILFNIMTWGGVIFLTIYGGLFFKSFLFPANKQDGIIASLRSRKAVIATTLAVTLLNPHVYLDTVMIIGSISSQYVAAEKLAFLFGTALASLTWFYALAFSAAKLSLWLSKQRVQRVINLVIALIMWGIAISLTN